MTDEELWRRRFLVFGLVRLSGLALFFLGLAVAISDLLRLGGWPLLGTIIALAGLSVAVVVPSVLKRRWGRQ